MFGLGKKKKKAKKKAKEIKRFTSFLRTLQARSPTTTAERIWGTILSRLMQSYGEKAKEAIQTQTLPTWQEAQRRAEILQQTGAPGEYGRLSEYFAERFGKWLTQKTEEATEKARPEITTQWRTIYETLTKPEFGTVYGLATTGKERFGASPVPQIRETVQEAVKSYQEALKSLEDFLTSYGITDITPTEIIKSIWG